VDRDGRLVTFTRSRTGWHGDKPKRAKSIVPVLSLGETRRFLIRHRD
jgi:alkylated DNA repair dioxygenase AlkB